MEEVTGQDGMDGSPTLPGDKKVTSAWPLQRGSQSVPVRLSDDN